MSVDVADAGYEGVEVGELGAGVVCAFSEEVLEAEEVFLRGFDFVRGVEDLFSPTNGAEEFPDLQDGVFAVLAWDC